MTRPQAVLLDAGGVLLLPNPWAVASVLRAAGAVIDLATIRRAHYAGVAAMDTARSRDWGIYHRVISAAAQVSDERFDDALAGLNALFTSPVPALWNVVPDGVLDQLRALEATGAKIAVVSNADGLVETTLRRCGVHVDVVIDSTVVGYSKPQPEIFGLALDKLGVAPANAVHVGDMVSADVEGAHAAGVRPLHLDPFDDCTDPAGHHEHVHSLVDVVAMVTR
jgi:putative hydrolase of the HAD superfamily